MITAIIQARMGSRRCEGKVMKEVLGKPLIGYMLERVKFSRYIDKIVLATSDDKRNDPLRDYVKSLGYDVFVGDENDVLDRYFQAASLYGGDNIVRMTGDCPLIDMQICDRLFEMYLKEKPGFADLSLRFAEGLACEIFSFDNLKIAWQEARLASEREHVTVFFNKYPQRFGKLSLDNKVDDSRYRITVDEPADFEVVKDIITALYHPGEQPFDFNAIRNFLDTHPDVYSKNSNIIRGEGLKISLKNDKIVKTK